MQISVFITYVAFICFVGMRMNILTKYLPRTLVYGKCIGVGKNNGIQVYKKISKGGKLATLTSFNPDGTVFKQLSVENQGKLFESVNVIKDKIVTIVRNFKENTITHIEKCSISKVGKGTTKLKKPYDEMTKIKGVMDENFNLSDKAKQVTISLSTNGVVKTKNKTVSYPDGSSIFHSTKKDRDNVVEELFVQDIQMPGGQLVNRFITRESKVTPLGERLIAYNGKPGQNICCITDSARTNF